MLTVEHYELIRRKFLIDGMSQRAIAQELGHSRKTIAKAIARAVPPGYRMKQPRRKPAIAAFSEIVQAWLSEDEGRPRKQRHTAQRIFERLRDEHGYGGSSCTVRRYVATVKPQRREVFMPLEFKAGEEAQVDWGEARIIENGQERTTQLFCMRFCHSKASFVFPYERANLESFLDGHVRAFEFFGGVPRRIAYDNLKSAVIRVGRGRERKLTQRFLELRSWYLFDSRFCNVARGNEKGDVENLVKRAERTYLTPLPAVTSLSELAMKLRADCARELERPNEAGQSYRTLWAAERAALLPLPPAQFEACIERSTAVDKQSLVSFDDRFYSAPVRWAHWPAVVRGFVDRIEIYCDQQRVAVHERSYKPDRYVLEPTHYLRLLERKPGCLDHARPFRDHSWGDEFTQFRRELEYRYGDAGTKQFIAVLLLMEGHSKECVSHAVKACVDRRAYCVEAVRSVLRNDATPPITRRLDLSQHPEWMSLDSGIRPVGLYEQLMNMREEVAA